MENSLENILFEEDKIELRKGHDINKVLNWSTASRKKSDAPFIRPDLPAYIKKTGDLKLSAKILKYIVENPGCVKDEIIRAVHPNKNFSTTRSYNTSYFSDFSRGGFIRFSKRRPSRVYPTEKAIKTCLDWGIIDEKFVPKYFVEGFSDYVTENAGAGLYYS